ncbi:ParB N-terminal domain-containing protein [Kiritimatiellota bacterium B12222]|nr:ParB N-terminal domain-containing protein [Kiritimatiellota bacterium B12222]
MTDTTSSSESSTPNERLIYAPVQNLRLSPLAPKNVLASPALMASVKTYGILQPILVRPSAEGYEVVAGFKRYQAAREAGLQEVPVRVYRVDDEALSGIYAASNVSGDSKQRVVVPSSGEYKPSGKLGGLLEEELNRAPNDIPYKSVMTVAGIIILLVWGGLVLKSKLPKREPKPKPAATATAIAQTTTGNQHSSGNQNTQSSSGRISVAQWKLRLADVDGIRVEDESGVPRIIFDNAVFSRLVTIDDNQKPRLKELLQIVVQTNPRAVLSVIGHTDNDRIRPNSEYRSNEYLSELRAKEVIKYLESTGLISSSQLRPIAGGANEPPYPNDTAANKVKNRTVSIEIMQPAS